MHDYRIAGGGGRRAGPTTLASVQMQKAVRSLTVAVLCGSGALAAREVIVGPSFARE
jgi:hypothetical protein